MKMANQLKITLIKSPIAAIPKQRATIKALGLRKIRQTNIHQDNKAIRGMIQKVNHLVKVEEV